METEVKKRRNKYAVMLVKEHEDGEITSHHIGTTLCEFILIVLFVLFAFFICKLIYDNIVIKDLRKQVIEQMMINNDLTDENESLTVENNTLTSKVSVLSETVSKKAATEDALSQEEIENALPKGFPLSGSATMEPADDDGKPMVKFKANSGVNIISSGTGTVISIEDDADYGNRIIIDHENGYKSIYRNAGEVLVKTGDNLGKGYILFSVGNSNKDLGYQIMYNEEYIDPSTIIEING